VQTPHALLRLEGAGCHLVFLCGLGYDSGEVGNAMPATHSDFKAQVGHAGDAGLRPQDERLGALEPGRNPYVTGTALSANSPVFVGRARHVREILAALRRPDKPACERPERATHRRRR
jgi:hypothetical protein